MIIYIYSLCDPTTKEIRYVGKTNNIKYRYNCHISSKLKTHCSNWIQSLKSKNLLPKMELLDECNENNWIQLEQYWISQCKTWGFNLTNHTIGGEGLCGIKPSDYTRDLMSKNRVGKFTNKLSENQVYEIRNLLIDGYGTKQIGLKYNVSKATIQCIREGKTWKHLGKINVGRRASTINPENIKTLYSLFDSKKSIKEIKKELNICISTIAKQRKIWKITKK